MNEFDLEMFCHQQYSPLIRALTLYTGDAELAKEIAQDALVRVCTHWNRVRKMDSPQAWTFRVAFNLARSMFRRRAAERKALRRLEPLGTEIVPDPNDPHSLAVRAAVSVLPPRQRAALIYRYFLDYSIAQTANLLDCEENTVKKLTKRGLDSLRSAGLLTSTEAPDAR